MSRRVYERLAAYRSILAVFSGTPFALYYGVDEGARRVAVFAIEWMRANPTGRFSEGR